MNGGKRIVVLGGGSGGVAAATQLGRSLGRDHEVTLVDRRANHVYMPAFLFLMVGQRTPSDIQRPLERLAKNNVRVMQAEVRGIDPAKQRITLDNGFLNYDYLIIALGLRTAPEAIPGFAEGAHHAWELDAALRMQNELRHFQEGRVLIGMPPGAYRCPPAPYETQWLLDEYFRERGIRDRVQIDFFTPSPEPMGEEHDPAIWMDAESKRRGIRQHYQFTAQSVDPSRKVVSGLFGYQLPYDLLFMVPRHEPPQVLLESRLADSRTGVSVNYETLETRWGNVYAIGDCADMPASKAGVVAHQEAAVVAHNLAVKITGRGEMKTLHLHTI